MVYKSFGKVFLGTMLLNVLPIFDVKAQVVWEITPENNTDIKSELSNRIIQPLVLGRNVKGPNIGQEDSWELVLPSNHSSDDNHVEWKVLPPEAESEEKGNEWIVLPQDGYQLPRDQRIHVKERYQTPLNYEDAQYILNTLQPREEDYQLPLRLGLPVPTANQVPSSDIRLSSYQLSPFTPGEAGGTGNQNYGIHFDFGLTDSFQLSGFVTQADDPLYSTLNGFTTPPANFWESYGAGFKYRLASDKYRLYEDAPGRFWNLSLAGSIEAWNVGSGGCDSAQCKGQDDASPNIFNNSGRRVYTRNLVGSLTLPFSWNVTPRTQLSLSPGISFLPGSQGEGQGGKGNFYGNNFWISGGAFWRPFTHVELFSSALLPLGPGDNSFDENLSYQRVPIFTTGLSWNLNPRISLEGTLTNGWGATPATSLLALPSSNQLGYSTKFVFNSGAPDTPQLPLTLRQDSLSTGGITVNTALVPPDQNTHVWLNLDNKGNIFGSLSHSISNIFQLDLYQAGQFNQVNVAGGSPSTELSQNYATDGGLHWRVGGKAVALSPLRGAPIWTAGRISLGRNNDVQSYQGYIFAESINTWEANPWLALNVNPKIALSGVSDPWGIGLSANIQLGRDFQLIPELNVVASHPEATNTTLALRWLADPETTFVDLYISNAAGMVDIAQLMRVSDTRIGTKLSIIF